MGLQVTSGIWELPKFLVKESEVSLVNEDDVYDEALSRYRFDDTLSTTGDLWLDTEKKLFMNTEGTRHLRYDGTNFVFIDSLKLYRATGRASLFIESVDDRAKINLTSPSTQMCEIKFLNNPALNPDGEYLNWNIRSREVAQNSAFQIRNKDNLNRLTIAQDGKISLVNTIGIPTDVKNDIIGLNVYSDVALDTDGDYVSYTFFASSAHNDKFSSETSISGTDRWSTIGVRNNDSGASVSLALVNGTTPIFKLTDGTNISNFYTRQLQLDEALDKNLIWEDTNVRFEFNDRVSGSEPTDSADLTTKNYCDTTFSGLGHTHDASEIVSGTFADALVAVTNVTQWVGSIDHDALLNVHQDVNTTASPTFVDVSSTTYSLETVGSDLANFAWSDITDFTGSSIADLATKNHSSLTLDDGANPHGLVRGDIGLGAVDSPNFTDVSSTTYSLETVGALVGTHAHTGADGSVQVLFTDLDFTLSDLASLATKNHSDLTLDDGSNPHGTTVADIGATLQDVTTAGNTTTTDIDMTGGAGFWFRPPQMTTAERDAMTLAWGVGDAGKEWFNSTTSQWEGWTGVAIVIIG